MPEADDWQRFFPKPPALVPPDRFHVFISYRSVNRAWVLRLYDQFREAGYEVFLDQYFLASAAPLASSLSEAIELSRSAVMIWSAAYEDSNWCISEYNALHARENEGNGFRFGIA